MRSAPSHHWWGRPRSRVIPVSVLSRSLVAKFATKLLLNTETGITRLRGRPHQWWLGTLLIPTFHPAAALRGGDRVADQMREDFALVRTILDSPAEPEQEAAMDEADPAQMELFG